MTAPLDLDYLRSAPKVLLHDHLDGGLRPGTVAELADECGYTGLPAETPDGLAAWFRNAADSGSLELYLETFAHTVAVMQTPSVCAGSRASARRTWPTTAWSTRRCGSRPNSISRAD